MSGPDNQDWIKKYVMGNWNKHSNPDKLKGLEINSIYIDESTNLEPIEKELESLIEQMSKRNFKFRSKVQEDFFTYGPHSHLSSNPANFSYSPGSVGYASTYSLTYGFSFEQFIEAEIEDIDEEDTETNFYNFIKKFIKLWLIDNSNLLPTGRLRFTVDEFLANNLGRQEEIKFLIYMEKLMAKISNINFNSVTKRKAIIEFYVDSFDEIPSGNHMIRAYAQMEKLTLEMFDKSEILMTPEMEKMVTKFDKTKSLALNNASINERKVAFFTSVKIWQKITGIELELAERK